MKDFKAVRWFSCILEVLVILLTGITSARAATINVTANAADVLNGANGSCSLREAIATINIGNDTLYPTDCPNTGGAYGTSDTINIPAGTYTTTRAGANEDLNATGDYDINKSVSIVGAGASTTIIDGGALDRVFHILGAFTVSFSGVTIRNGNIAWFSGGGIFNSGGSLTVANSTISGNVASISGDGGGIYSSGGSLTVANSTISGNTSANNGAGMAIYSSNLTNITNSTISGNTTLGYYGGIYLSGPGTHTLTNSTISGNTAQQGGGLVAGSPVTVTNSTIVRNTATGGVGGGVRGAGGAVSLINSIVADNFVGSDCSGTITNNGSNIDKDSSCTGFTHSVAMVQGTGFSALASNGGPTQTHALLAGSAAIDAGVNATCAAAPVSGVDQRGTARPQGATCDIGAYELVITYTVTYNGNTNTGGNAPTDGSSPYNSGGSVTVVGNTGSLTRTGYTFSGWNTVTDGSGTSYAPANTFTIAANTTLYALWTPNTYTVTTTATNGTITTTNNPTVNYGATTTVTGSAIAGYYFTGVSGCSGTTQSNTNQTTTTFSYTTGTITAACTVSSTFAIDTFAISLISGGNGTLTGTASQTINYGGSATAVTAVPTTGYHFVNWTGTGGFVTTTTNPLTVTNVTAAQTITANFAIDTYTLTYTAGANGSLTGTTSQTLNHGSSATAVTAVPATGYHLVNWTGTGGFVTTTTNPLTVTNVTAAQTITANFAIDTFAISFASGGNGTLTGTASQTINYNGSATAVTAVPATGYHLVNWTGTGGFVTTTTNPLTVTNVTAAQTITANFAIDSYTVTPSAGTGGSISPSTPQTINYGSTTNFTVTPNTGYTASVGGTCGGTLSGKTYITDVITGDCTVKATFKKKTYQVTPSAGANGTISPAIAQTINYGSTTTFTVTPNTGYIASVGGTCDGTLSGNTYTTKAITGNCTVMASFTVTQAGIQYSLTLTKSGTGSGKGLINNSGSELLCGADCELAVLKYEAGTTLTLSAAPETGTTFKGWSEGGCSGTALCTVTLSEDTSINAVFSVATAASTDSSTSTITTTGNDISINVPVIKYTASSGPTTYYSTAFVYVPTSDSKIWFKLTMADVITDITPYLGTQMSQLYFSGIDLMLHLNNITINGIYIWADLKYMPTNDGILWFVVTAAGEN